MSDGSVELFGIAARLEVTGLKAPAMATAIVTKGALNIKNAMRDDARGIAHLPTFPLTINFDVTQTFAGPEAEIGPDDTVKVGGGPFKTPGNLAGVVYFGNSRSGPQRNLTVGLDAEAPRFEKALADAAEPDL